MRMIRDCTVHIPYTNAKTFANVVLPNNVSDKELKSIDGVGTGRMTKKDDIGVPTPYHQRILNLGEESS
ncbi:hypothetical protein Tco_1566480 [Tanacetum coccineum]